MTDKEQQFKEELKELLIKYDAHIYFSVGEGSDTYGFYDEALKVDFMIKEPGNRCKTIESSSILSDGWGIDQTDL